MYGIKALLPKLNSEKDSMQLANQSLLPLKEPEMPPVLCRLCHQECTDVPNNIIVPSSGKAAEKTKEGVSKAGESVSAAAQGVVDAAGMCFHLEERFRDFLK